jgi:hypothetical protein
MVNRTRLFRFAFLISVCTVIVIAFSSCGNINTKEQKETEIVFPNPFAVAIDDMGWMGGGSLGDNNGPFRLGFKRDISHKDYQAVIEIGKRVGVRFQGLFILCEMDRLNLCARVPSSTSYGKDWDNKQYIGEEQLLIMNLVREEAGYLEFGLHGVGHEFWVGGVRNRAEWYNLEKNHPWPEKDIRNHLELFTDILGQYGLTPEKGHSFPESFVPCAYGYFWNPSGDPYSLGKILNEYGVRFANTLFSYIPELNPPEAKTGGYDHGVFVIDRYNHGNLWHEPASLPKDSIEHFQTDMIESHFANWLATDDFLQHDLNDAWVKFFREVQSHPEKYLAKNTEQFYSQWILKQYAQFEPINSHKAIIDTRNVPAWAYQGNFINNLVLKYPLGIGKVISKATLNGIEIPSICIDQGWVMLYLPVREPGVYTFELTEGESWQKGMVINDGTYNVYNLNKNDNEIIIDVRVYGTQVVKIVTGQSPTTIFSSVNNLKVLNWSFDKNEGIVSVNVSAHDIQGESGSLILKLK